MNINGFAGGGYYSIPQPKQFTILNPVCNQGPTLINYFGQRGRDTVNYFGSSYYKEVTIDTGYVPGNIYNIVDVNACRPKYQPVNPFPMPIVYPDPVKADPMPIVYPGPVKADPMPIVYPDPNTPFQPIVFPDKKYW